MKYVVFGLGLAALAGCVNDSSSASGDGQSQPSSDGSVEDGFTALGVEPYPEVGEEPPALCDNPTPADWMQFTDDSCHVKKFPRVHDREATCQSTASSKDMVLADGSTAVYRSSSELVVIDNALRGIVPDELDVVLILVRRVDGVPYYRYVSNGSALDVYQPWSTTKVFAAANAGATLRRKSGGTVGLTASVDGYEIGDLITAMTLYSEDPYTSNGLGKYFHNVGGRHNADRLIHDWIGRPYSPAPGQSEAESFGGNYGADDTDLGYHFVDNGGEISIDAEIPGPVIKNRLSAFTSAEFVKRMVLFREEPSQRMPDLTWPDVQTILYGAATSEHTWGGMSADLSIYLQSGYDIDYLDRRSQGQWNIYSKLGAGDSGEFANNAYGCFPVLDDAGKSIPDFGREMILSVQLSQLGETWAERDRILARAVRAITIAVIEGKI